MYFNTNGWNDVSKDIDINKTDDLSECIICKSHYFVDIEYQTFLYDGGHDL